MTRALAAIIAGLFDGILPERITTALIGYSVRAKPIQQDNSHRAHWDPMA